MKATLKLKVKLVLCFDWAPRHGGVLEEWRYNSTHLLTSALDGGEWSAPCPGRCTRRKRAPGTHWIGGRVGPRARLDAVVKRKIPSPQWESNPRTPIVQPVAQRYTDLAITALMKPRFRSKIAPPQINCLRILHEAYSLSDRQRKAVPVPNYIRSREDVWGSGVVALRILNRGIRLKMSSQVHAPAALPPVPISQEAGWTPDLVWMQWRKTESLPRL
jgi:hypothetical protein